ncbi:MAG: hypothetical protein AAFP86_09680, partial [Planctomycetota bacterium]
MGFPVPSFSADKVFLTEGSGDASVNVTIPVAQGTDLTFPITRGQGDADQVTVPSSVTITAGSTSAPLAITSTDDGMARGQQALFVHLEGASGSGSRLLIGCNDAGLSEAPRVMLVTRGGPCRVGVPQTLILTVENPDTANWITDETYTLTPTGCTLSAPTVTLGPSTRHAYVTMTPTTGTPSVSVAGTGLLASRSDFEGWDADLDARAATAELAVLPIPGHTGPQVVQFTTPILEPDGSIHSLEIGGRRCSSEAAAWHHVSGHPFLAKHACMIDPLTAMSEPGEAGAVQVTAGSSAPLDSSTPIELDLTQVLLRLQIVDGGNEFVCNPFDPADPNVLKTSVRYDNPYTKTTVVTCEVAFGGETLGRFYVVRESRADMACEKISILTTNSLIDAAEAMNAPSSVGHGRIVFDRIRITGLGGLAGTQRVEVDHSRPGNASTEDQFFWGAGNNVTVVMTNTLQDSGEAQMLGSSRQFPRRFCVYDPATVQAESAKFIAQGRDYAKVEGGFGFEEGGWLGSYVMPRVTDMPAMVSGQSKWAGAEARAAEFLGRTVAETTNGDFRSGLGFGGSRYAGWFRGIRLIEDARAASQGDIYFHNAAFFGPTKIAYMFHKADKYAEHLYAATSSVTHRPLTMAELLAGHGNTVPFESSFAYDPDLYAIPLLQDPPLGGGGAAAFQLANVSNRWNGAGGRTLPYANGLETQATDYSVFDNTGPSMASHYSRDMSQYAPLFWATGDELARIYCEEMAL